MNKPSSTSQAGLAWGWLAALIMGGVAMAAPDVYSRVPPGFEAALAVGIGFIGAYFKKENVLDIKR
jgi:hypothetical protein